MSRERPCSQHRTYSRGAEIEKSVSVRFWHQKIFAVRQKFDNGDANHIPGGLCYDIVFGAKNARECVSKRADAERVSHPLV